MISVQDRSLRLLESAQKIQRPFELDESLCLYSPQDNVDSLQHPRIVDWIDFVKNRYEPKLPKAKRRILLFMPCTKTKPYPFSSEHKAINQRILNSGFKPIERLYLPQELQARLEPEFSQEVLNLSALSDGKGTVIHRMVISEPLGIVPYEHIASYLGRASPASAYDDPGLFEKRGNAASPWRKDCTAVQVSPTRWSWGDEERRCYVTMHNAMAEIVAAVLSRIGKQYTDVVSWVAPGLTHRSFVISRKERRPNKVALGKLAGGERLPLIGANDLLPEEQAIECLPTLDQCKAAVERLAHRLGTDITKAKGVYSRGGANATPLALPELLDVLIECLTASPEAKKIGKAA
ncbi:MAG: hypothetical protein WBX25_06335 [Rhodomicrobium sp.]